MDIIVVRKQMNSKFNTSVESTIRIRGLTANLFFKTHLNFNKEKQT